jgi:hypothetical protein
MRILDPHGPPATVAMAAVPAYAQRSGVHVVVSDTGPLHYPVPIQAIDVLPRQPPAVIHSRHGDVPGAVPRVGCETRRTQALQTCAWNGASSGGLVTLPV